MSHTYALLAVSEAVYKEIATKLRAADYPQAFHAQADGSVVIDMHGVALVCEKVSRERISMAPGAHMPLSKWKRLLDQEVFAEKIIVAIVLSPIVERIPPTDHDVAIVLASGAEIGVPKTFIAHGMPGPGDYFVQQVDGGQSWVSGKAFEAEFIRM